MMKSVKGKADNGEVRLGERHSLIYILNKYKVYYLMILPMIIYLIIFSYLPMGGIIMAFQDFRVARGILRSEFIGLENFIDVFTDGMFWGRLRNTVIISVLKIIFTAPAPIILALLLNEVNNKLFKRTIQTIVYLPKFVSWVVVASIVSALLDIKDGPVNTVLVSLGIISEPMLLTGSKALFRPLLVITDIWKGVGWGSIIYLATLTSINPEYYEAATIDGANRLQKTWYITLPFIKPTFMILIILSMGSILSAGFDQVYVMANTVVMDVGDIIDTYVYRVGLASQRYGYASAVGLFKSVVSIMLVTGANWLARKTDNESLF